nr:PREDICTED: uncharacterized protein LOC105673914 [Linepithema humile]
MYFRYQNKLYSHCIICDANVLSISESVENHLNSHSKKQRKNHILRRWSWKYFTKRDDFVVECNICYNNVSLSIGTHLTVHIKTTHSDELKNIQETHDTPGSSERVLSLETDRMPLSIANKKHVWKYYIKLSDFKAQCKFCEKKYNYLTSSNCHTHISKHHTRIWKYEKEKKLIKLPWIYFKYQNKLYSQCIICDANVLSTSESVENHLNSHSEEQRKNHILRDWSCKYFTKRGDFVVECNICHNNVSLSIKSHLTAHIKTTHSDELKNIQKTRDTADSSERVLSLETDRMPLSIANKKHVWKYYIKLPDFKAQCKFCEKKYNYLNSSNCHTHISKHHTRIWKYEKEKKLVKWPWMYFSWLWRNCTKRNDLEMEYNNCHKSISVPIRTHFNDHNIDKYHWTN